MKKKHRKYRSIEHRYKSEGEIIKEYREAIGYSHQEIANILGIQVRQYQRFEYGERSMSNASMKLGLSICAILNLDPFWFVFGDRNHPCGK